MLVSYSRWFSAKWIVETIGPFHHGNYPHMPVLKDRLDLVFHKPVQGLKVYDTNMLLIWSTQMMRTEPGR